MRKMIALVILIVPVFLAGLGIKYMRDSMFGVVNDPFTLTVVQFVVGLGLTIFGVWFIGGYILHRERKNKRVSERFIEQSRQSRKAQGNNKEAD
ncbi:DUF2627 domain-containing protein [Salinicoccus halodurans]|uniref:Membrane protein n=1 Tax=Salinicoccus halodurans TaxID=407035 RepID=A0A0F7HJW6_9STAP|nr:DUF2627 domain-containing protein [Salinicoccus halodurans]AKG74039.1 membrane protein [Salinicoccus halodurans]SFK59522.1 Protein of unknown function [Salinicoccus halodurans]